ncbi:MAG: class I SAM-dependent methyltransferase [Collinsella sp.]
MGIDATAGFGEDSLLLAAAGFTVDLYEQDCVIAALLKDALDRAAMIRRLTAVARCAYMQARTALPAFTIQLS